ncbi:MAG: hypothetical protein ABH848_03155 [Candidatus Omnitrophota bacterium]
MIVKMKKLTVIVESKDIDSTLGELGKAGLLHVEHENAPTSSSVQELEEKYRSIIRALELLPDVELKDPSNDIEGIVHKTIDLADREEVLIENLRKLEKTMEDYKYWGDFEPETIYSLGEQGISVKLYSIQKKDLKKIPKDIIVETIFKKGNVLYIAVISQKEIDLPFNKITLPGKSLSEMKLEDKGIREKIDSIKKELIDIAGHKKDILSYKEKIGSILEYQKIHAGRGIFENLTYVKGYSPVDTLKDFEKLSQENRWGLLIEDPKDDDPVPTLIKNPRWIEIIRPLFNVINTIPGYKEVDISMWFLLFFSIFFGILIGDAGYGVIFFIVNLFCHIKFGKKIKDKAIFHLIYVLSIAAILWGVFTGTFFGQAYLNGIVEPLFPALRDNKTVQAMCFLIGGIHLTIAHLWKFIRKAPSLKALSEVGWILIIWSAYFIAKAFILDEAFPGFGKWLVISGAGLIVLFTDPRKNIFKGIGSGVGSFLMNVINSFTDVVSYIRLFAVGAATVAVADAFNQMSLGIGFNSVVSGFLTAFILLFGHTLNIILGAMAILVHGVRLNVLEFSSHLDMEWSGVEYRPFKKEGV